MLNSALVDCGRALPIELETEVNHDMGVFAQDRWTTHGLTATA